MNASLRPAAVSRSFMSLLLLLGMVLSITAQYEGVDIYVSSRTSNSVKRFSGEGGTYLGDFVAPDDGGLSDPQEVVFGADSDLYVTGFQNPSIKRYDGETGAYVEDFTHGYTLVLPTKTVFHPDGRIYVAQWGGNEKVIVFDQEDGSFIEELTSTGIVNGCGIDWDSDGNIYVASWGQNGQDGSVHKFDPDGVFQEIFITTADLSGPVNIWFGGDGNLFVLDWTRGNVELFDSEGVFLDTYITGMFTAEGFVFAENGDLLICDWSLNRVNRYDSDGNFIEIFASGNGLGQPNSVTFGPAEGSTSVDETGPAIPVEFSLKQNFPNPFNPRTTIRYTLPASAEGRIFIFNVNGEVVWAAPVEGSPAAGEGEIVWAGTKSDGGQIASGIYYYRLESGDFSATRSMLLVR